MCGTNKVLFWIMSVYRLQRHVALIKRTHTHSLLCMEQYGAFQFCCPSSLSSLEWQKVWPIWWLLGWQWLLLWSISHPVQHAHCSLQLLQKPVVKQMSSSWLPCLMFPQRYIIFVHYFCSFWIFIFFLNSIFMTINFIKDTLYLKIGRKKNN